MLDEDKIDPFPARTTLELEEMLEACYKTKEILSREGLIYSNEADFSKYNDTELVAMNHFVRENSRMLSIILAGGKEHFWNGQGLSTVQELKTLYVYIDDKVKQFLLLDRIMDTLEIKMRYGRKSLTPKAANPATHPELLAFTHLDATRAPSSQESLVRLAAVCEKFAVQCRTIAQTRASKMEDRSRKLDVKEKFEREVDLVLPMLRQHVLKIGLSKTMLKEKGNVGGTSKLTSIFTHRAVEDAHRAVEDCRERLMQELLFRRAKVERRLEKEEAEERARAKAGAKAREQTRLEELDSYKGLVADERRSRKEAAEERKSGPGARSESGGRKTRSASPGKQSVRPSSKSPPVSRDSSPARPDSPSAPDKASKTKSPEKKGGSKAKAAQGEGSPKKSPKARSKKKA